MAVASTTFAVFCFFGGLDEDEDEDAGDFLLGELPLAFLLQISFHS